MDIKVRARPYVIHSHGHGGPQVLPPSLPTVSPDFFGLTMNDPINVASLGGWPTWNPNTVRLLDVGNGSFPTQFLPGWGFTETADGVFNYALLDAVLAQYRTQAPGGNVVFGFKDVAQWAMVGNAYSFSCTITAASPGVVTATGSSTVYSNGQSIFFNGGTLPTGLTLGTYYWIVNQSGNTFQVAATRGGTPINTSGSAGSSTVTLDLTPPANQSKLTTWITSLLQRSVVDSYPIRFIEGQDEPNNSPPTPGNDGWQGTVAELITMQQTIFNAAKAFDTSVQVLSPPSSDAGSFYGNRFMVNFLQQGGGAYFDILAYHAYPNGVGGGSAGNPEQIYNDVATIRSVMASVGINKPIWITEYDSGASGSMAQDTTFMAVTSLLAYSLGIQRQYWYAYENASFGQMWTSAGGLNSTGICAREMYKWMVGASMPQHALLNGVIYTVGLARTGGYQALAVWTTDGSTPAYPTPSWATQSHDVAGSKTVGLGATVTLGRNPILLENFNVF